MRKIIKSSFVLGLACFALNSALAVTISTNIPTSGGGAPPSSPGGFINNFYIFSLMISGVLAFGAIVYGGVRYTLAAGNPSGQQEGKEWVKGALIGLLLLVGAYTILKVINPSLVNMSLPKLVGVRISAPPASAPTTTTDYLTKVAACIEKGTNLIICNRSATPQSCAQIIPKLGGQCDAATGCILVAKNCCGTKKGGGVGGC